jgi:hypothetical protein|tara:strand:- start:119 stop:628 length:510 start_codon:yes stop_codon:yes gene_type:complete
MYYNEKTKKIESIYDIINNNPNTSFPMPPSDLTMSGLGWYPVQPVGVGSNSSDTKVWKQDGVEEFTKDGVKGYKQKWIEVDRFSDIKDSDGKVTKSKADQDADFAKELETSNAINQRRVRNGLLEETDHYGLSDVTMSNSMKTYRQALRDLPTHKNWPNLSDSDWPTKP